MNRQEALAQGVLACKQLTARFFTGFNDVNHVRQTPDLPNHLAWCLGHLALTMHRAAAHVDGNPAPASDFVTGDGTDGSRTRGVFDTESVSFGSRPSDNHEQYPAIERCVAIYNNACDRLAATVRAADDAALDRPVRWGPGEIPFFLLVTRMIFHNGAHTGQITDLRRALGMRPVLS